jgi:hypothetical protein
MWQQGDKVLARRDGDDRWLPGTVRLIKEGKHYVQFDDGVFELATALRSPQTPPPLPAAVHEPAVHGTGDRVLGRWLDLWWYPATILYEENGRYQVQFDDGDQGLLMDNQILPLQPEVGEAVQCRPKEEVQLRYRPGRITRVAGEVLDVEFDDGDGETNTSVSRVRLWRCPVVVTDFPFHEGDRVLGALPDGYLYPADLLISDSDRVVLQFLNGIQGAVTPELVSALSVETGMRVEGRWRGGQEYFPGEIDRLKGERLHVRYDDGDEEWTTVRLIRIPDPNNPPVGRPAEEE